MPYHLTAVEIFVYKPGKNSYNFDSAFSSHPQPFSILVVFCIHLRWAWWWLKSFFHFPVYSLPSLFSSHSLRPPSALQPNHLQSLYFVALSHLELLLSIQTLLHSIFSGFRVFARFCRLPSRLLHFHSACNILQSSLIPLSFIALKRQV